MTQTFKHKTYDAVIIGARCAGAATAMLLARSGARVLLVDRETDIQDTLSTHALMRPAVSMLDSWGLLDGIAASDTPVVRYTQFHYGAEMINIPVKPSGGAGESTAIVQRGDEDTQAAMAAAFGNKGGNLPVVLASAIIAALMAVVVVLMLNKDDGSDEKRHVAAAGGKRPL